LLPGAENPECLSREERKRERLIKWLANNLMAKGDGGREQCAVRSTIRNVRKHRQAEIRLKGALWSHPPNDPAQPAT